MSDTGVVLGFYRERAAAAEAVQELRRQRFGRCATIYKSPEGRVTVEEHDVTPGQGALLGAALGLMPTLVALLDRGARARALPLAGPMLLVPPLAGALAGWLGAQAFGLGINKRLIARYGRWVVRGETLVVVQASADGMERALSVMRGVGSEGPAVFVVRPGAAELKREDTTTSTDAASTDAASATPATPSRREPLTVERLKARAQRLAAGHRVVLQAGSGQPLLHRLRDSEAAIEAVRDSLSDAARLEQSVSISGEWLLDNAYLVQGQIKDVRRNLPRRYYHQLPVLPAAPRGESGKAGDGIGSLSAALSSLQAKGGTPRVYAVALDLIAHTDSRLDRTNITDYLRAFQEETPLSMGELWAAPLMLRLALIERLRGLATRIDERQRERERADFWANRLRHTARRDADHLMAMLGDLTRERARLTPHFADRLRSQLLDEEAALTTVQSWLERKLDAPLADIIQSEARRQMIDQLSISNIIGSLRALMELDWREIFEETSLVHVVLRDDPAGIYAAMDFATRDHYRHVIEELARRATPTSSDATTAPASARSQPDAREPFSLLRLSSSRSAPAPAFEPEVARLAVQMAAHQLSNTEAIGATNAAPSSRIGSLHDDPLNSNPGDDDPRRHVGYFLLDDGRAQLEAHVGYRPRVAEQARRFAYAHPAGVYIGGIGLITASLTVGAVRAMSRRGVAPGGLLALGALALLPLSELAAQLVDYALTRLLPPRGLPKMSFENGLPAGCKTLVVVPMMLLSEDGIREDVERLEVRYLANAQAGLQFALLSDFADAEAQHMPDDEALLQTAVDGIAALNARYDGAAEDGAAPSGSSPQTRFFLFHRERQWAPGEERWIGWERKRGKIEELNHFLCALPDEQAATPHASAAAAPLAWNGVAPDAGLHDATALDAAAPDATAPDAVSVESALIDAASHPTANFLRVGDVNDLRGIRYVITLDADTQLPHDSARRMIETMAHPLNRAVIADEGRETKNGTGSSHSSLIPHPSSFVKRGYGILQPMVSTALPSAINTRFSRLMTDPRGTDPYTHLVSNVYQDLSGEGAYHGKGMYDLHAFQRVLAGRFPEATLLSHDLLEGSHVRVGLASDIELFDQFPANYLAYAKRQHRWIRGDWQISDWATGHVPDAGGVSVPNPLSRLNRWKIFDNLRRSLVPVATVALLPATWFLWPGAAGTAGAVVAGLLALPTLTQLATWLSSSPLTQPFPGRALAGSAGRAVFNLALLPHQAGLSVDAIARVAYRRRVSRRNLLEWQTSQVAESRSQNREQRFVRRLGVVSLLSVGIGLVRVANYLLTGIIGGRIADAARRGGAMQAQALIGRSLVSSLPFLIAWAVSPLLVKWLSGGKRALPATALPAEDKAMLRHVARETWRYFDDFIGPQTNWLPPDNYQEHLNIEVAPRTSPTNIGLWMLSALAARDFGYLSFDQVGERNLATVETLETLERHDGHLLNWYDITTTAPLNPRYISTVDSGNLLVSLWTFSQGCREMLDAPVLDASALRGLDDTLAVLRAQMKAMSAVPPAAAGHIETLSRLFADYRKRRTAPRHPPARRRCG